MPLVFEERTIVNESRDLGESSTLTPNKVRFLKERDEFFRSRSNDKESNDDILIRVSTASNTIQKYKDLISSSQTNDYVNRTSIPRTKSYKDRRYADDQHRHKNIQHGFTKGSHRPSEDMRRSRKNIYGYETETDSPAVRDYISRRNTDPHSTSNKDRRSSNFEECLRRKSTGEDYLILKPQHGHNKQFQAQGGNQAAYTQGAYTGERRSMAPSGRRDTRKDFQDFDTSFLSDTKQLIDDCKSLRSELSSGVGGDVDARLQETIREQIRGRDRASILEDRGAMLQDRERSPLSECSDERCCRQQCCDASYGYEAGSLPASLAERPGNNGFQASRYIPLKNKVVYDAYHGVDTTSIRGSGNRPTLSDGGTQTLPMQQTNPIYESSQGEHSQHSRDDHHHVKRQPHLESERGAHHSPGINYGPHHEDGTVDVEQLTPGPGYYYHHHRLHHDAHAKHHDGRGGAKRHHPSSGNDTDVDVKLPNGGYYHHRHHHRHHQPDNHHSDLDRDKPKQFQPNHDKPMLRESVARNSFETKPNPSSCYSKCMSRVQRRGEEGSQRYGSGSEKLSMAASRGNKSHIPVCQPPSRRQHQPNSDRQNETEIDWELLSKCRPCNRQQGSTFGPETGEETSSVLFQNSNIKLLLVQKPKKKITNSTNAGSTDDTTSSKKHDDDDDDGNDEQEGVDIKNFVKEYQSKTKPEDNVIHKTPTKHETNASNSPSTESVDEKHSSHNENSLDNPPPGIKTPTKHETKSSKSHSTKHVDEKRSSQNGNSLDNPPPNNESGETSLSEQSQSKQIKSGDATTDEKSSEKVSGNAGGDDDENDDGDGGDNTKDKQSQSDISVTKGNSRSEENDVQLSGSARGSDKEKLNKTLSSTSFNSDSKLADYPRSDKSSVYGSASELPTDVTGLHSKGDLSEAEEDKELQVVQPNRSKDVSDPSDDRTMTSQAAQKKEKDQRPPNVTTLYVVRKPPQK